MQICAGADEEQNDQEEGLEFEYPEHCCELSCRIESSGELCPISFGT